ncbi:hypothetical protein FNU76_00620 [Chitinimonas arctica]|uniref:Uncharacterized protein n=1 Tax=Chitinimonas arctica TaxID=2594795 RepID=A0A516SA85_9NEIS|nr:hypothetical protein [Chitinimonas arctica]QDQ24968.1 hypothetical protein FNU76_00620 [Chitinimonas arctica]
MRLRFVSACLIAITMLVGCGGEGDAKAPPEAASQIAISSQSSVAVEPENGWWWNPAEGGRGFAIERQGNQIFLAAFLYETNGLATWYTSTLNRQADGSYAGAMLRYSGGQTLLGPYKSPAGATTPANITLTFNTSSKGALLVTSADSGLNRNITLERFPISTPAFTGSNGNFESGWWWNEAEGGRGYFIEVQGATAFIGSFMYDGSGQPVWYVSTASLQNAQTLSGSLLQYANGQSLMGDFKAAAPIAGSIGTMGFSFTTRNTANLLLPNGANVPLKRFNFNPTSPTVEASLSNCFKVNSNVVKYHLGAAGPDGKAHPTHRLENIPLSGFGQTGAYRINMYAAGTSDPMTTGDQELMLNGLKPLVMISGTAASLQTTVTTTAGHMPFDLSLNQERTYTLQQRAKTTVGGQALPESTTTQIMSATLLGIGPLQTFAKHFPLTCKIKERVISPDTGGTYNILWYAQGYGVVRWEIYTAQADDAMSLELVSVEAAPN